MYSACGPFTKYKNHYKNLKKKEVLHIFIETYYKLCFQYDMLMGVIEI